MGRREENGSVRPPLLLLEQLQLRPALEAPTLLHRYYLPQLPRWVVGLGHRRRQHLGAVGVEL